MRSSKAGEKGYTSRTTSKTSYTSEMVSDLSSQSTCAKRDKASWSRQLPAVKTALNTVIKEAFAGEGEGGRKPAIVDLCDEDKRRIMNLVEELAKHVEEKRVLRGEMEGLRVELEGEGERGRALEAELVTERAEREALAGQLEAAAAHRGRLEARVGAGIARGRELERERARLRSQLAQTKRRLHHAARVADEARADLRGAAELIRRFEEGRGGQDQATQTEEAEDPPAPTPPTPMSDGGAESLLLGELFFTAPGIPREIEPIFFLPAPFNRFPEDRDVWSFRHDRLGPSH